MPVVSIPYPVGGTMGWDSLYLATSPSPPMGYRVETADISDKITTEN